MYTCFYFAMSSTTGSQNKERNIGWDFLGIDFHRCWTCYCYKHWTGVFLECISPWFGFLPSLNTIGPRATWERISSVVMKLFCVDISKDLFAEVTPGIILHSRRSSRKYRLVFSQWNALRIPHSPYHKSNNELKHRCCSLNKVKDQLNEVK